MANWKDVKGYEGLYLVSDYGEVISLPRLVNTKNKSGDMIVHRKAKKLKPHLRGRGNQLYPCITLTKDNKSKTFSLHRLVAIAFIPNPDDLPEVNHKDENPFNCRVENLEWCTRQYNIEYSKSKRIEQYYQGEKIAEYKSIRYAEQITGISRTAINNALKGWSKSAGGYEWKYGKDERRTNHWH
jgi:hypothetical protein